MVWGCEYSPLLSVVSIISPVYLEFEPELTDYMLKGCSELDVFDDTDLFPLSFKNMLWCGFYLPLVV